MNKMNNRYKNKYKYMNRMLLHTKTQKILKPQCKLFLMLAENIVQPIFNVGRKYSQTFLNANRKNSANYSSC